MGRVSLGQLHLGCTHSQGPEEAHIDNPGHDEDYGDDHDDYEFHNA